jgi:hypothetical protein
MLAETVSITPEEMAVVMAALVAIVLATMLLLAVFVIAGGALGNRLWKRRRPGRVFSVPVMWILLGTLIGGFVGALLISVELWALGPVASFAFGLLASRVNNEPETTHRDAHPRPREKRG